VIINQRGYRGIEAGRGKVHGVPLAPVGATAKLWEFPDNVPPCGVGHALHPIGNAKEKGLWIRGFFYSGNDLAQRGDDSRRI